MCLLISKLGKLEKVGNVFQLQNHPHKLSKIYIYIYLYIKLESWVWAPCPLLWHKKTRNEQLGKSWKLHPTFQLGRFFDLKILIFISLLSWKNFQLFPNFIRNFQLPAENIKNSGLEAPTPFDEMDPIPQTNYKNDRHY